MEMHNSILSGVFEQDRSLFCKFGVLP